MHLTIRIVAIALAACGLTVGCASSTQNNPPAGSAQAPRASQDPARTYDQDTVIREATGVFGAGAEGVAKVVERVFQDLGRPNAYIVGREVGGAIIAGLRYGDGTLYHKVEGERIVNWTGPSIGPDVGGDASKSFTLVYNLNDSEEIFQRFPAVEGKVYFIGGFSVNYHQRGNIILAPIRLGAGWRLGANIGWLNYTKTRQYIPF